MRPLTPEDARDHLSAASTLAATSRKAALNGAVPTAVIGVLIGTVTFMFPVFAAVSPVASAISLTVLVLWLGALIPWQYRRSHVAERGWSVRYGASFGFTVALYAIGIIGWSASGWPSWPVFAAYCVLVALPMVLMAVRMAIRAARL